MPSYQTNCISAIIQVTEGRMLVSPAVEYLCNKNKHHTITLRVPGCTRTSQISGMF